IYRFYYLGIKFVTIAKTLLTICMKFTFRYALAAIVSMGSISALDAQIKNQPYSFQHYQKYDEEVYSVDTRYHTSSKPYMFRGKLYEKMDSLPSLHPIDSDNWFLRMFFNEHLIQVEKEDHTFYLDVLPDFMIGSELIDSDKRTTWLNTRGIQAGVT